MTISKISITHLLLAGLVASNIAIANTAPSVPENLTATLYNGAGGEVTWNRSSGDDLVIGYEVSLNGNVIGVFDALSYYDSSLQAGTTYSFTVTAIDSTGQRSATSSVTLGALSEEGGTNPSELSPPAQLQASVYSSTGAELFWARSSTPGLLYEIRRDGNIVATTDGVSFYTNDLSSARSFNFSVIAIDNTGRRSEPTLITVNTNSNGTAPVEPEPTPEPLPVDNTRPEIAPQNLSIAIYSDTAAEIFWVPAGISRPRINSNEIRRNGILIDTVEGEFLRSYFDSSRVAGEFYTYEITAVSITGRASATISDSNNVQAEPITPPPTTTPTEDLPENVRTTLDTTFEIINGVAVEKIMATIGRLGDIEARSTIGLVSIEEIVNEFESVETFSCPNGGELRVFPADREVQRRFSGRIDADACAVGPIVFSGFADWGPSIISDDSFSPASFGSLGLTLTDSRDASTITAEDLFFFTDEDDPRFSSWSSFNLTLNRPSNGYRYSLAQGRGRNLLNALPDGTFGLTVDADEVFDILDSPVDIQTLGPMEFMNGREGGRPNAGRVFISSNSEELLINAFNGDPATFTLTSITDGASVSYTVNFSDEYQFEAPIFDDVDIGF